jgi:Family of unknown function (DUF5906)
MDHDRKDSNFQTNSSFLAHVIGQPACAAFERPGAGNGGGAPGAGEGSGAPPHDGGIKNLPETADAFLTRFLADGETRHLYSALVKDEAERRRKEAKAAVAAAKDQGDAAIEAAAKLKTQADIDCAVWAKDFEPGATATMTRWIERQRKLQRGVYFSPASLRPMEKAKKPKKIDIVAVRHLWVDIDPSGDVDPKDEAALDAVRADILEFFGSTSGLPAPTWIIDSGRGFWLIWELAEPLCKPIDAPDGEWLEPHEARGAGIIGAINAELEQRGVKAHADACFNADRIARLPYTVNLKTGRLARAIGHNAVRHELGAFPLADIATGKGGAEEPLQWPEDLPIVDVYALDLSKLGALAERARAVIKDGPAPTDFDGHRSRALWFVMRQLIKAGVNPVKILSIILDQRNKISEHVLEKANPRAYAEKEIEKAVRIKVINFSSIKAAIEAAPATEAPNVFVKLATDPDANLTEADVSELCKIVGKRHGRAEDARKMYDDAIKRLRSNPKPKPELKPDARLKGALNAPVGYRTNEGLVLESIDQGIEYMNKHFAYVRKYGVMEIVADPDYSGRLRYDFLSRKQAEEMFASLHVKIEGGGEKGEDIEIPIFGIWFKSESRRQFSLGVEFHPSALPVQSEQWHRVLSEGKALPHFYQSPPGMLNLWRGFGYAPKRGGSWALLAEHLFNIICKGDNKLFQYVIRWAAYAAQHPEKQGEVALVFQGGKGCGKGIFCRAMVALFGQHGMQICNPEHLTGKFNRHLGDCGMLFCDEAFHARDTQHESVLKSLVTEPTLPIEAKFVDVAMRPNRLHLLLAANADWVVPASADERRYCVINVSAEKVGDYAYFKAIMDELEADDGAGYAAMLDYLLSTPLLASNAADGAPLGFNVRDYPDTKGLAEQKRLSLGLEQKWWKGVLYDGRLGVPGYEAEWKEKAPNDAIYQSYEDFMMNRQAKGILDKQAFGNFMSKYVIASDISVKVKGFKSPKSGKYRGPLLEARAIFEKVCGVTFDWECERDDADEGPF